MRTWQFTFGYLLFAYLLLASVVKIAVQHSLIPGGRKDATSLECDLAQRQTVGQRALHSPGRLARPEAQRKKKKAAKTRFLTTISQADLSRH